MPIPGLLLALSWLTVLPVSVKQVNRRVARDAIRLAPLAGLLLGLAAVLILWLLVAAGAQPLLAGLLVVGLLALLTRGMHVDGLADTVDGLGCYGAPERALAVMKDSTTGPFAVVGLIVVLGAQAASLAALATEGRWVAVVLAVAAGRAAFGWCCRLGVDAARPDGMGALVADSQPLWVGPVWAGVLAAAGISVDLTRPWLGPLAIIVAAGAVAALSWHTARRFGGLTGDVLGAASEVATTVVLVVCSLAP